MFGIRGFGANPGIAGAESKYANHRFEKKGGAQKNHSQGAAPGLL
jgi:hypothetical protein